MLIMLALGSALAGPWFQGSRIDWWGDGLLDAPESPSDVEPPMVVANSIRAADALPFDWAHYADPSSPLFWDDGGDWVPPRPLREVLADPSPENIARYREWTLAKMALAARGQSLLWGTLEAGVEVAPPEPVDWSGVRVLFFYASGCPHCTRAVDVVHALGNLGASVQAVHLDEPHPALPGSVPYNPSLREVVVIRATPTWLLESDGHVGRVAGYATVEQLERVVRRLEGQNP